MEQESSPCPLEEKDVTLSERHASNTLQRDSKSFPHEVPTKEYGVSLTNICYQFFTKESLLSSSNTVIHLYRAALLSSSLPLDPI